MSLSPRFFHVLDELDLVAAFVGLPAVVSVRDAGPQLGLCSIQFGHLLPSLVMARVMTSVPMAFRRGSSTYRGISRAVSDSTKIRGFPSRSRAISWFTSCNLSTIGKRLERSAGGKYRYDMAACRTGHHLVSCHFRSSKCTLSAVHDIQESVLALVFIVQSDHGTIRRRQDVLSDKQEYGLVLERQTTFLRISKMNLPTVISAGTKYLDFSTGGSSFVPRINITGTRSGQRLSSDSTPFVAP